MWNNWFVTLGLHFLFIVPLAAVRDFKLRLDPAFDPYSFVKKYTPITEAEGYDSKATNCQELLQTRDRLKNPENMQFTFQPDKGYDDILEFAKAVKNSPMFVLAWGPKEAERSHKVFVKPYPRDIFGDEEKRLPRLYDPRHSGRHAVFMVPQEDFSLYHNLLADFPKVHVVGCVARGDRDEHLEIFWGWGFMRHCALTLMREARKAIFTAPSEEGGEESDNELRQAWMMDANALAIVAKEDANVEIYDRRKLSTVEKMARTTKYNSYFVLSPHTDNRRIKFKTPAEYRANLKEHCGKGKSSKWPKILDGTTSPKVFPSQVYLYNLQLTDGRKDHDVSYASMFSVSKEDIIHPFYLRAYNARGGKVRWGSLDSSYTLKEGQSPRPALLRNRKGKWDVLDEGSLFPRLAQSKSVDGMFHEKSIANVIYEQVLPISQAAAHDIPPDQSPRDYIMTNAVKAADTLLVKCCKRPVKRDNKQLEDPHCEKMLGAEIHEFFRITPTEGITYHIYESATKSQIRHSYSED